MFLPNIPMGIFKERAEFPGIPVGNVSNDAAKPTPAPSLTERQRQHVGQGARQVEHKVELADGNADQPHCHLAAERLLHRLPKPVERRHRETS